jgi:ADP-ribose pyrophosphatase YjhB (NUDIX family)
MYIPEDKFREIERLMPLACFNAIIVDSKGRVLVMKRNNEPAKGLYWFPGGRIKRGQSLEEALKEQIEEETGLKWSDLKVLKVASVDSCLFKSRHTVNINFILKKLSKSEARLDQEHSDFKWVKPEEFDKEKLDPYLKWAINGAWGSFKFDF